MGRLTRGDEADTLQRQMLACFFGQAQVAEVNGVEGATEQPQRRQRIRTLHATSRCGERAGAGAVSGAIAKIGLGGGRAAEAVLLGQAEDVADVGVEAGEQYRHQHQRQGK